jgi:hypothetical protein
LNWALSHWLLDHGKYQAVLDLLGPTDAAWTHPTFDAAIVYSAAQDGLAGSDPARLAGLRQQWAKLLAGAPSPDADWELRQQHGYDSLDCAVALAAELIREGKSGEANAVLVSVDTSNIWESGALSAYTGMELLCRIAGGLPLNAPLPGESADADIITAYCQPGGRFAGMLDSEAGVALLRSPLFFAALRERGAVSEHIRAELYAAIRPERENYGDYSNGGLRAGAL